PEFRAVLETSKRFIKGLALGKGSNDVPAFAELPFDLFCLMQLVSVPEHPGIIKLLEWFTVPTKDVLVLELVEASMNLTDYMKIQDGHLTEDLTKNILSQVVDAVQHIHSCLVFHRDLKPGNILIQTTTRKIKLIDFGCGTMLKKGKYQSFEGTTLYAPPEVFSLEYHEAIPTTSWSLGVTLFELLCGQLPFQKVGEILCGRFIFTQDLSEGRKVRSWHGCVRFCINFVPRDLTMPRARNKTNTRLNKVERCKEFKNIGVIHMQSRLGIMEVRKFESLKKRIVKIALVQTNGNYYLVEITGQRKEIEYIVQI
uniref:non-specific serine/threonine protein kinase n=1 Tax=Erpetoichthys calabaricus TaxID=27687 RepID=A0A8C4S5J2_ERPCA